MEIADRIQETILTRLHQEKLSSVSLSPDEELINIPLTEPTSLYFSWKPNHQRCR